MTTRRLHIRGNMGTQILQAAAALATIGDNDEPILCVNHGNLAYQATDLLQKIFEPNCRIINIDEMHKTPYWKSGVAKSIFTNREKIFKWLQPDPMILHAAFDHNDPALESHYLALHVRGSDKKIASPTSYQHLYETAKRYLGYEIIGFSDDVEYAEEIFPDISFSIYGDVISDYKTILRSDGIFAAPSTFIMSMLLFNPDLKITFLGDKYCDGGYDVSSDMIFLREAVEFCPNVEILD